MSSHAVSETRKTHMAEKSEEEGEEGAERGKGERHGDNFREYAKRISRWI